MFRLQPILLGLQRSFRDRERSFRRGQPIRCAFCDKIKPVLSFLQGLNETSLTTIHRSNDNRRVPSGSGHSTIVQPKVPFCHGLLTADSCALRSAGLTAKNAKHAKRRSRVGSVFRVFRVFRGFPCRAKNSNLVRSRSQRRSPLSLSLSAKRGCASASFLRVPRQTSLTPQGRP